MYFFHRMVGGGMGIAFGLLLVLPVAGKLVAKQLIELSHEGFTWLSQQPLAAWQGQYYAFDDVQVRIYEVDSELWFTVGDVLKAIDVKRLPASFVSTHRAEIRRVPGTMHQAVTASALAPLLGPMREAKAG